MSDRDSDRCGFVFNPVEWEEATEALSSLSDDVVDESGVWRCPHQSKEDQEQCVFHLPPDQTDNAEAYFDGVTFPGRVNFTNTEFNAVGSFVDLSADSETCCIDLQNATISDGALVPASKRKIVFDLRNATVGDIALTENTTPKDLFTRFRSIKP
jgi:hypothetical protein